MEMLPSENPIIVAVIDDWKMGDCYARFLVFNSCDETRKHTLPNSRTSFEM